MQKTSDYRRIRSEIIQRERSSQTPLLEEDKDLSRILQLVEIIRRYEFLVDHLLENTLSEHVAGEPLWAWIKRLQRNAILNALAKHDGNVNAVAKQLQISRPLVYRIKENE